MHVCGIEQVNGHKPSIHVFDGGLGGFTDKFPQGLGIPKDILNFINKYKRWLSILA